MDSVNSPQVVLLGLSANPPANNHLAIVRKLTELFEKVIIIPRGTGLNKPSTAETTPRQRKDMVNLAFVGQPNVKLDFYDLDNNVFTPTWILDKKYKVKFQNTEIWHAAGGDLIKSGSDGNSEIQAKWQKGSEIWTELNWAIIDNPAHPIVPQDLPPHNLLIKIDQLTGRSTTVRDRVRAGQPISNLVPPAIEQYIIENYLYKNGAN